MSCDIHHEDVIFMLTYLGYSAGASVFMAGGAQCVQDWTRPDPNNPKKTLEASLLWQRMSNNPHDPGYNNMRLLFPQVYLEKIAAEHRMTLRRLMGIMHMHHLSSEDIVSLAKMRDKELAELVDKVTG